MVLFALVPGRQGFLLDCIHVHDLLLKSCVGLSLELGLSFAFLGFFGLLNTALLGQRFFLRLTLLASFTLIPVLCISPGLLFPGESFAFRLFSGNPRVFSLLFRLQLRLILRLLLLDLVQKRLHLVVLSACFARFCLVILNV